MRKGEGEKREREREAEAVSSGGQREIVFILSSMLTF